MQVCVYAFSDMVAWDIVNSLRNIISITEIRHAVD